MSGVCPVVSASVNTRRSSRQQNRFGRAADLTDGDLEELGVLRRPQTTTKGNSGAGPHTNCQLVTRLALAALPRVPQSFAQLDPAERRPITVMFCDLVGSTELAPLSTLRTAQSPQELSRRGLKGGDRAGR